jgi:putative transposase
MPWEAVGVMALKLEFVKAARAAGGSVAAACRTFGISRQTGHKWLRRFEAMGYDGLAEQSRRPVSTTGGTSAGLVQEVLALRARRPRWGAKTIVGVLKRKHGPATPSVSTVTRVLRRYGHLQPRRAPVRVWAVEGKAHVEVHACNDLWTIDFKGWWLARSRERCEPLTVRDAFSKLVLATALVPTTSGAVVRRHLVRLFRRHGVPRAIWVDNGTPWICMRSRGGLTQLSAWLVALGIEVHRSRVGCPQDNGGHERMHRDLAVLEATPAATRRAQQRMCDRWRVEFNHVRPHQALGGRTPAEVYKVRDPQVMRERLPTYPPSWTTRRVRADGRISLQGDTVFISTAVAGRVIGLEHLRGLQWRAHYFRVDLGIVEIAPRPD